MMPIHYPEPEFRTRNENGNTQIFDSLRKKWLLLTPEEWVRQNFVRYLTLIKQYPASLIAQEKEMKLGELRKRFDILIYNTRHQPWMMVECKAADIQLNQSTLEQVLRYNIAIPVEYIIITNGSTSYGWQKNSSGLIELSELPGWGAENT